MTEKGGSMIHQCAVSSRWPGEPRHQAHIGALREESPDLGWAGEPPPALQTEGKGAGGRGGWRRDALPVSPLPGPPSSSYLGTVT